MDCLKEAENYVVQMNMDLGSWEERMSKNFRDSWGYLLACQGRTKDSRAKRWLKSHAQSFRRMGRLGQYLKQKTFSFYTWTCNSNTSKEAFFIVGLAYLLVLNCPGEKTWAAPLRVFAFPICVGIWKIVEAENFLECPKKKKKKKLELLNWVFPKVSAKGRQLFFLTLEMFGTK